MTFTISAQIIETGPGCLCTFHKNNLNKTNM